MFEFLRQLDDKARLYGSQVVVANRWYPSSKTCSCCGVIKQTLALSAEAPATTVVSKLGAIITPR